MVKKEWRSNHVSNLKNCMGVKKLICVNVCWVEMKMKSGNRDAEDRSTVRTFIGGR